LGSRGGLVNIDGGGHVNGRPDGFSDGVLLRDGRSSCEGGQREGGEDVLHWGHCMGCCVVIYWMIAKVSCGCGFFKSAECVRRECLFCRGDKVDQQVSKFVLKSSFVKGMDGRTI
jgi:hypothetical protein